MTGLFSRSFQSFEKPILDNYEVVSELGCGGHSTVYLAKDQSGQEVAIKRWLNPELEPVNKERLRREIEVLRAVEHPYVVQFIEICKDQSGRSCIVMEYVRGRSLRSRLESGVLGQEEAIDLALILAETLSFLSSKKLVHRDIKPSNVILREADGAPILIDFSIVTTIRNSVEPENLLTKTGSSIGTAPYMPPEQCEGVLKKPLTIDCRTDIYGVGALLFHALTGFPPWSKETAWERLTRNPWDNPYPGHLGLRDKVVEAQNLVDRELSEIIRRCLHGEPSLRIQTPSQLQSALLRCRSAKFAGETSQIRTWFLLISAVILLCLLGISFSLFPEIRKFFDHSTELNPNSLQNNEQKRAKMKIDSIVGGTLIPLMVIAAGSELEAQMYEETISSRCGTCLAPYSKGSKKCALDGGLVREQKIQAVRNTQSYFPLENGLRWEYVGASRFQKQKKQNHGKKRIDVQVVDSKTVDSKRFTGVKGQLGVSVYMRQDKAALFRLNVEGKEEVIIPYPLTNGQSWRWKAGLPIPVSIRFGNPIARLRGFTELTVNEKTIQCLTIRVFGATKPKVYVDLYFGRHIGLVKYVHHSANSLETSYRLSNTSSFLSLQKDIGAAAIRKVAAKWNHSFFSQKPALLKPLTDYPIILGGLRKSPYLKDGSYQAKGGAGKFASHEELLERVLKKQMARARPKGRWERNKEFSPYQVKRATIKSLQRSATFLETLLLGRCGPVYVVTLGDPKAVDSVQLFLTPEGKVFAVFSFD